MEVNKALMLDYVASEAEQQRFACERPLDRVLLPLQQVSTTPSQASCLMHFDSGAHFGSSSQIHLAVPVRNTLLTNSGSAEVATLLNFSSAVSIMAAMPASRGSQMALTDP